MEVEGGREMNLTIRKAELNDMEILLRIRNKHYIYEVSRRNRPLEYFEYMNWFIDVLSGKKKDNTILYVILDSDKVVGSVRYDFNGEEAEISLSFLKKYHRKGVGSWAFNQTKPKSTKIIAEVANFNEPSNKFFIKLGFKLVKEDKFNRYELEDN